MDTQMVELYRIDPDVITSIRDIKSYIEDYKILESAIKKDGQRNPITVRYLTDEERGRARSGAEFGIIDGHHRFDIASKNNFEKVLVEIEHGEPSPIRDSMLAFQLNTTSIKMSPAEKGKVIHDLLKLYEDRGEKKTAHEIGQEVFGLQTAMAYRCLQEYKKIIGAVNKRERKRNKGFVVKTLRDEVNRLPKVQKDVDIAEKSIEDCVSQLNAIRNIESQLRFYKETLLAKEGVKERYKSQSKEERHS